MRQLMKRFGAIAFAAILVMCSSNTQVFAAQDAPAVITRSSSNAYFIQLASLQASYSLTEANQTTSDNGIYVLTSSLVIHNDNSQR